MLSLPKLNHAELYLLYEYDLRIPKKYLEEIFNLPKESLVEDLKVILDDAKKNIAFYERSFSKENDKTQFFAPLHTFFILGELGAKEALSEMEDFLSQSEEIIDFWFQVFYAEAIWEPLLKISKDNIIELFDFIKNDKLLADNKIAHETAICYYLYLFPDTRRSIIKSYKLLIHSLLETRTISNNPKELEKTISGIICNVVHYGIAELTDEIKQVILLDICDDFLPEDLDFAMENLKSEKKHSLTMMNIYDRYEELANKWLGYITPFTKFCQSAFYRGNAKKDIKKTYPTYNLTHLFAPNTYYLANHPLIPPKDSE